MTPDHIQHLDRLLVAAPRMQLYAEIRKAGGVVQFKGPLSGEVAWANEDKCSAVATSLEFFSNHEIRRKPEPRTTFAVYRIYPDGEQMIAFDLKTRAAAEKYAAALSMAHPLCIVREFVEVVK